MFGRFHGAAILYVEMRFQIPSPKPGSALVLPLIAMLTRNAKPDAFCEHTLQQNTTAERAGELTALPQIL